ncbi:MAG: hypothetical protein EOP83_06570 [Verrucomicrobiaceae bacterium]|nr:MAG: hypothetical protein EOP83_06570 [Verrucomicrobiaceae bacterium]
MSFSKLLDAEGRQDTVAHRVPGMRGLELRTLHPPHPDIIATLFVTTSELFEPKKLRLRFVATRGQDATSQKLDEIARWMRESNIDHRFHKTDWGTEYMDAWVDRDEAFAYTLRFR